MPVGVGTVDRHIHAAQGIDDAGENGEIHNCQVIYADAQVVQKSGFEQACTTVRVMVHLPILIGGVDAVHADGGDVNVQVARDGNKRDLPGRRADSRDDDGICPEIGLTGTDIGAQQRESDRLVVGQDGKGLGSIGRSVERLLRGDGGKDGIRVKGGRWPIR